MCLIQLEEQTRNRTLGLLGTNDYLPINDMRMRNGQVNTDIPLQLSLLTPKKSLIYRFRSSDLIDSN